MQEYVSSVRKTLNQHRIVSSGSWDRDAVGTWGKLAGNGMTTSSENYWKLYGKTILIMVITRSDLCHSQGLS